MSKNIICIEKKSVCFGCRRNFYNSIIFYNGATLCKDCMNINEIYNQIQKVKRDLNAMHVRNGTISCQICQSKLIDPISLKTLMKFEADHVDPFEKKYNISDLLFQHASIKTISIEICKCRILCLRCHSVVTYVQRESGLHRILIEHRTGNIYLENTYITQLNDKVNENVNKVLKLTNIT